MEKNLLEQANADLGLTMAWLEDTLQPSINLMRLKGLIYDMDADIKLFEKKNGRTENTAKSAERVNLMIELVTNLDKVATQNNIFQLVIKHSDLKMIQLRQENHKLKIELGAVKKAWES